MKTLKTFMLMCGIALSSLSFTSCLDDNESPLDGSIPAIVTIKPESKLIQLDDSTVIIPSSTGIFSGDKEQRAKIFFKWADQKEGSNNNRTADIMWMDSILTKDIAENLEAKNDSVYGKDEIGLNGNSVWAKNGVWIEDGYLNINFVYYPGGYEKHFLNLIVPDAVNEPYTLEFRHNAYKDPASTLQQGLVAFRLNKLPDTKGETVTLKLKYKSYDNGETKTIELPYKTKEK